MTLENPSNKHNAVEKDWLAVLSIFNSWNLFKKNNELTVMLRRVNYSMIRFENCGPKNI